MVDSLLVAVTLVSLLLALAMGVITGRVLRVVRRRSGARAAALEAAGRDSEAAAWPGNAPSTAEIVARLPEPSWPGRSGHPRPDAAEDPWNLSGSAVEADPPWTDLAMDQPSVAPAGSSPPAPERARPGSRDRSQDTGRRLSLVLGVGAVVVLGIGSSVIAISERNARLAQAVAHAGSPGALELVSLTHARDGQHLSIRGVVRNPARSDDVEDLAAVVYLFDRQGAFLGTSQAAIVQTVLAPGAESPFEVSLPDGTAVGRYRLSFRVGSRMLPHVDVRGAAEAPRGAPAPLRTSRHADLAAAVR